VKKHYKKKLLPLSYLLRFCIVYHHSKSLYRVSRAFGEHHSALQQRLKTHPELVLAKTIADEYQKEAGTLADFVFHRLSKEAQATWKQLQFTTTGEMVEQLFRKSGLKIRQSLFVYALVASAFDLSKACAQIGISRDTLELWRRDDLSFQKVVMEINWHKKNFFESRLIELVEDRHPGAIVFVNKTLNADRGYGEKLTLEHTGMAQDFSIDDLDLDLETKKKVLEAIRAKKAKDANQKAIAVQSEAAA
jgi:hypothetical protein